MGLSDSRPPPVRTCWLWLAIVCPWALRPGVDHSSSHHQRYRPRSQVRPRSSPSVSTLKRPVSHGSGHRRPAASPVSNHAELAPKHHANGKADTCAHHRLVTSRETRQPAGRLRSETFARILVCCLRLVPWPPTRKHLAHSPSPTSKGSTACTAWLQYENLIHADMVPTAQVPRGRLHELGTVVENPETRTQGTPIEYRES